MKSKKCNFIRLMGKFHRLLLSLFLIPKCHYSRIQNFEKSYFNFTIELFSEKAEQFFFQIQVKLNFLLICYFLGPNGNPGLCVVQVGGQGYGRRSLTSQTKVEKKKGRKVRPPLIVLDVL